MPPLRSWFPIKPASRPVTTVKLPELSSEKSAAVLLAEKKTSSPLRRGSVEMLPRVLSVRLEPELDTKMLKVAIGPKVVVVTVTVPCVNAVTVAVLVTLTATVLVLL